MDFAQAAKQLTRQGPSHVIPGDYFALGGGLDLETPPLERKPGTLLGCLNWEAKINGGYETLAGFERFDGRTRPSQAQYWLVAFTAESGTEPAVGDTVTASSGGSGVVLQMNVGVSVVLGRLTGTLAAADTLTSGTWSATASAAAVADNSSDDDDDAAYKALATTDMRNQVTAVPGSGGVLGVAIYRGVTYAVRNTTDGTAAKIYSSSSTGWTEFALGWLLKFTAGQAATIAAGDALTGATSGATGTVRRVVVQTGSFAGGDAAGYVVLYGVTGTFSDAEAINKASSQVATANGASSANTLKAGTAGCYEFLWKNFYAATGDIRLYGCDGVNNAFELQDGADGWYCPILTGMATDTPTHIAQCFGSLWLSFPGGSIQRSGVNDPCSWDVSTGAAEFGLGDDCTGLLSQTKTLFCYSRSITKYLQDDGTGTGNLIFDDYNDAIGANAGTPKNFAGGIALDDRGFSTISTTFKYGAFVSVPVSILLDTLVKQLIGKATCSVIIPSTSRYRCFFNDGQFISCVASGTKILAFTRCQYSKTVRCAFGDKDADGNELTVFGDDDGYVYVMDSGTSFDGDAMTSFMRTNFYHSKSPGRQKRYRWADFDISCPSSAELSIAVDYSYARTGVVSGPAKSLDVDSGGGFWDVANWDQFRWSTGFQAEARCKLEGAGDNISFLFSTSSDSQPQISIDGVMLRYSPRRLQRGSNA